MSRPHRLPLGSFDELATGRGSPQTIRLLRSGQVSTCLLRIRALLDQVTARCSVDLRRTALDPGYELLAAVQAEAPGVAAQVFAAPETGAWAAHCLRRLAGSVRSDVPLPVDLARLGSFAATAGHLAGLDFAVPVAVHRGTVTLPRLGRATLDAAATGATARREGSVTRVETPARTVRLPADPAQDGPGWTGLRHLVTAASGLRLKVCFDDLGPFWHPHGRPPAGRVGGTALAQWQRALDQAWGLLATHHPDHARALAAGLSTIVPLRPTGPRDGVSASVRGAFGAVAMTLPPDPMSLAATLVHEFAHSKLGALLDLVTLHAPDDGAQYFAPWRDDPRPLGGLLQGAYAFLGVADFWRVQCTVAGPHQRLARVEFARWRDGVAEVLGTLVDSARLTRLGTRFVSRMRERLAGWRNEFVPAEDLRTARAVAADHQVCWRLRNVRPDRSAIDAVASAWRHGDSPAGPVPGILTGQPGPARWRPPARTELVYLRLREPARFRRLSADPDGLAEAVPGSTPADLAYAAGDYPAAVAGYRAQIDRDPESLTAWAGLLLALCRLPAHPLPETLLEAPEVVRAVYARLASDRSGPPVTPDALAAWLASPERVR